MENKQNIKDLIQKFYPHAKEKLGFDHPVRVIMRQDAENAQQSLGKTAYYDPAEKLIVLYVTDRHPKDVLRSFSHELVHHAQNCRGELDDLTTDGHYAKDGKGREIEEEAYLQGNLNLRDYEDSIKFEGVNEMKLTKSQLKGLIEQTIEKITEKKFPDLTGDGKVTQADILKGRGVKLKEEEPVDEQEMVVKADVKLPPEGQRILDMFDNFLNQADAESAELQAVVSAMMQKLQDKNIEYADPSDTLDVDEMHCGGKRDDELEEQEVVTPRSDKEKEEVKLKENNETWYNSSLYESLKSKWTK